MSSRSGRFQCDARYATRMRGPKWRTPCDALLAHLMTLSRELRDRYSSTPPLFYSSTPPLFYSSTPLLLYFPLRQLVSLQMPFQHKLAVGQPVQLEFFPRAQQQRQQLQ